MALVRPLFHIFFALITIAPTIYVEGSRLKYSHLYDKSTLDGIVTSIESRHGDIYDCYDIHNQPSHKHSALRGHKVKLRPSFDKIDDVKVNTNVNVSTYPFDMGKFWKSGKGCPTGSVPILRETRNNNLKIRNNKQLNTEELLNTTLFQDKRYHGVDFAGVSTIPGRTFYGASAFINVRAPKVPSADEYSSSSIFIEGFGEEFNQIEAGWTVNPGIYGDYQSRFFAKWVAGGRGCYDARCLGFFQTSPMPLGVVIDGVSEDYKALYEIGVFIQLERGHGWWLRVNDPHSIPLGYWPIEIFKTLRDGAYLVRFGGEVYTTPGNPSPQMGNGKFRQRQYRGTCYMREVRTVDESGRWIDGDNSYMQQKDSRCFYVGDNYYHGPPYKYSFVFGGTGGRDKVDYECLY